MARAHTIGARSADARHELRSNRKNCVLIAVARRDGVPYSPASPKLENAHDTSVTTPDARRHGRRGSTVARDSRGKTEHGLRTDVSGARVVSTRRSTARQSGARD